jgi:hypothetical protein
MRRSFKDFIRNFLIAIKYEISAFAALLSPAT